MRYLKPALVVCALALLATPALAHVPVFATDNVSPDTAHRIPDAQKSWSVYDRLDGDRVTYYEFDLEAGDELVAGTFTPSDGPFTPSMVVMGPGIEGSGEVPDRVEVPDGMNATVVEGRKDGPGYEPFTPAANYQTVEYEREVDRGGRYVLAVYEPDLESGSVGVFVGTREEFGPVEYATVPLDLIRVYLWEGDHPLLVFGPLGAVVLGGLAYARNRRQGADWERPGLRYGLALSAGLLLGTSTLMTLQLVLALAVTGPTVAAVVTVVFVLIPAGAGAWLLWLSTRDGFDLTRRTRIGLALAGLGGLVAWGGLVVGPVIALVAALFPRSPSDRSATGGDG